MLKIDLPSWLTQSFSSLPCGKNPSFFGRLWLEKRLRFHGSGQKETDAIDELSARLACAALSTRKRVLIILPNKEPRRIALLFATSLLMHVLDRMSVSQTGGQVLYFGSSVGIRAYLGQTSVGNVALDSVFPQARTAGGSNQAVEIDKLRLPQVLCVYSPADPVSVIQQNPADWIAVDLSDGKVPLWLPPLLNHAHTRGLPVVAWCQNPLSENVAEFHRAGGHVFRWPQMPEVVTGIMPVILDGPGVDDLAGHLRDAELCLIRAARLGTGRLGQDAVRQGLATLRALEGLSVPFDLYEAEARSYWGLRSIMRLQEGLRRFLEAVSPVYPTLGGNLEEACAHLETAAEQLQVTEPPLWTALTNLCVEDVPGGTAKIIVFPSAARKQIFAFALLSRLNITEEDLRDVRVWIWSLKEFRQAISAKETQENVEDGNGNLPDNLTRLPLLVGVPSPLASLRLEPVFRHGEVEVLLYPHQGSVLTRRVALWREALEVDLAEETKTISYLGGQVRSALLPELPRQRISLQAPKYHQVEKGKKATSGVISASPLWQPNDPVEEVKWLLQANSEVDEESFPAALGEAKDIGDGLPTDSDGDTAWVEEALAVRLSEGWLALFATGDTIQVIVPRPEGDAVEERYVRSLRVGDRVLFIHGQRRQSLYDLIISRVHNNPAIELHLALIQRWQGDFRQAYSRRWQERRRNVEELLQALRIRGSKLVSSQTLRFWLRGQTLCPDDAEDLRRLAEELDLAFVRQYYRRIHSAAQRLAGIHRGLALRLNHWLRRGASGGSEGMDDILDPELGLTFQDFRDSLRILRVEAVEHRSGPFSQTSLGQLERRGKDERL